MGRPPTVQWFSNSGAHRPAKRLLLRPVAALFASGAALVAAARADQTWLAGVAMAAVMAAICWLMQCAFWGDEPMVWLVAPKGLTALRLPTWRSYPWSSIERVTETEESATLHTSRGAVPLGRHILSWRLLADAVREHIGQDRARGGEDCRDATMPCEIVAGWLGLGPGEVLRIERGRSAPKALAAVPLVLLWTAVWAHELGSWIAAAAYVAILFGAVGLYVRWMLSVLQRQYLVARETRATGESLAVRGERGWREYGWGSLVSIELRRGAGILRTTKGDVLFEPGWDLRPLLPAIEQAIAARRAGEVLPRVTGADVPEAALSRAEAESGVSERAVSRSDTP